MISEKSPCIEISLEKKIGDGEPFKVRGKEPITLQGFSKNNSPQFLQIANLTYNLGTSGNSYGLILTKSPENPYDSLII